MKVLKACFLCLSKPFIIVSQIVGLFPFYVSCNHSDGFTFVIQISKYRMAWSIFYVTITILYGISTILMCFRESCVLSVLLVLFDLVVCFDGLTCLLAVILCVKKFRLFLEALLELHKRDCFNLGNRINNINSQSITYTYLTVFVSVIVSCVTWYNTGDVLIAAAHLICLIVIWNLCTLFILIGSFYKAVLADASDEIIKLLKKRLRVKGNIAGALEDLSTFRIKLHAVMTFFNNATDISLIAHVLFLTIILIIFCCIFTWKCIQGEHWSLYELNVACITVFGVAVAMCVCIQGDGLLNVVGYMICSCIQA